MGEIRRPKLDSSLSYGGAESHDPSEGHTKIRLSDPYGAAEISPTLARYQALSDQAVEMANYQDPGSEGDSYSAIEPEESSDRVPIASVDGVDIYADPRPHSELFDRASRVYSRTGRRLTK